MAMQQTVPRVVGYDVHRNGAESRNVHNILHKPAHVTLSELRYRAGVASYLDLLDAQRSLYGAQQAAVQANLQRLQNQVTLYRVLGGGWGDAVH